MKNVLRLVVYSLKDDSDTTVSVVITGLYRWEAYDKIFSNSAMEVTKQDEWNFFVIDHRYITWSTIWSRNTLHYVTN